MYLKTWCRVRSCFTAQPAVAFDTLRQPSTVDSSLYDMAMFMVRRKDDFLIRLSPSMHCKQCHSIHQRLGCMEFRRYLKLCYENEAILRDRDSCSATPLEWMLFIE